MSVRARTSVIMAALLLSITEASAAPAAHAADERRAERLFQEGVQLMKGDNCPQAIPKFKASQEIDSSAATLMNLGACYAKIGKNASSWRTYHRAADAAAAEGADDLKQRALAAISVLEPTLTRLKIVPPRGSTPLSLTLNGEPIPNDDGLSIPLDPGINVLEATAPGRTPWRRTVNAAELGATIVIEVPDLSMAQKRDELGAWRTGALIAGGTGVASIVTGSIFGLSARIDLDRSHANCRDGVCNAIGKDAYDDARQKARLSNYAIGVGAALTTAGFAIWFLSSPRTEPKVEVAPWIPAPLAPVGVSIRGRL